MSDALTYLMGNRWTKDAEGEFITVEDSHAVPPVSLSADGKSEQVTTTGKNLLSTSESEWTKESIPGVATRWICLIPIESGETYTWSRSTAGKPGFYFAFCDENFANYESKATLTNRTTYTATNSNNKAYIIISYASSYTKEQTILALTNYMCQIEKGATATSYEPYTGGKPSPSPDYPQAIKSVDDLALVLEGKNLLGLNDVAETTLNGITYSVTDNVISISGTPTTGFDLTLVTSMKFPLVANEKMAFSFDTAPSNVVVTAMHQANGGIGNIPLVTTINPIWKYVTKLRLRFTSGSAVNATFSVQMECGDTITTFAPYVGINVSNLLPNGYSLRSLPDGTKDELHLTYLRPSDRPGWAWYSREILERLTEQNVSVFGSYGTNKSGHPRVRAGSPGSIAGATHTMCNRFAYNSSTYNYGKVGDYYIDGSYAWFILPDSITSAAEANAWLADNPVIIVHTRPTPVITQLDPIELPSMQQGLTNLWSDPSTNLSVTYDRDRNIVISNMKTALDDLATS